MAVACGVKVLRFPWALASRCCAGSAPDRPTEFVIGALPLGGYVRMLDEREAPCMSASAIWPSTTSRCVRARRLLLPGRGQSAAGRAAVRRSSTGAASGAKRRACQPGGWCHGRSRPACVAVKRVLAQCVWRHDANRRAFV